MTPSPAPGANKAQGEYGNSALPKPVLALISRRETLKARLTERKRNHRGYLDVHHQLVGVTTKLLRAERRWERQQRSKAS